MRAAWYTVGLLTLMAMNGSAIANTFGERDYQKADHLLDELSKLHSATLDQISGATQTSNLHLSESLGFVEDGEGQVEIEVSHLQDILTLAANMVDRTDENDTVAYALGQAEGLMRTINSARKFVERTCGHAHNPVLVEDVSKFEGFMDRTYTFASEIEVKAKQHLSSGVYAKP